MGSAGKGGAQSGSPASDGGHPKGGNGGGLTVTHSEYRFSAAFLSETTKRTG